MPKLKKLELTSDEETLIIYKGDTVPCSDKLINPIIEVRSVGPFEGIAFYLDDRYHWIVGTDGEYPILVPIRKK